MCIENVTLKTVLKNRSVFNRLNHKSLKRLDSGTDPTGQWAISTFCSCFCLFTQWMSHGAFLVRWEWAVSTDWHLSGIWQMYSWISALGVSDFHVFICFLDDEYWTRPCTCWMNTWPPSQTLALLFCFIGDDKAFFLNHWKSFTSPLSFLLKRILIVCRLWTGMHAPRRLGNSGVGSRQKLRHGGFSLFVPEDCTKWSVIPA